MRPNRAIWVFLVCLALPGLWLAVTSPVEDARSAALIGGVIVTAGLMIAIAWRAHRSGALLPNRCATCGQAMCYTRPGEVKPPAGSTTTKECFWRCRHCGRLV